MPLRFIFYVAVEVRNSSSNSFLQHVVGYLQCSRSQYFVFQRPQCVLSYGPRYFKISVVLIGTEWITIQFNRNVCVCVCVCMHVYVCIYIFIHTNTHTHTHTHIYIYIHTHTHTYTLVFSNKSMEMGSFTFRNLHKYIQ